MIGLHIIADFYDIHEDILTWITEPIMKELISDSLHTSKLNELWSYYHTFWWKNEITGVVALAESHITFHIWPEKKYMSLDIFVCNLWEDNSQKAKSVYNTIFKYFSPKDYELQYISRNETKKELN